MEIWENKASDCMRRVPLLQNEIDGKMAEIIDLEQQIGQLQRAPPPPPSKTTCSNCLFKLLLIIIPFMLLLPLFILFIINNLDDSAKYRLFYHLQYLPFFELSSDDDSSTLIF